MPFIRGRYHINPIMGEALEAAREAEAALLGFEHEAEHDDDDRSTGGTRAANKERGRIHRIEIEATKVVPSNSGRAVRGFFACIHRRGAPVTAVPDDESDWRDSGDGAYAPHGSASADPETQVFSDHDGLMSFLRDELEKDEQNK
ncbi:MAG: hypothetical protein WA175_07475 [Candidatus Acidiferrales bacterium]